jgi:hypothetical protein
LLGLFAGVVLAGVVILSASDSPAQGKKEKGKTDTKEPKEPKEAKVAPPPTAFPKRGDVIDPSQGGVQHVNLIDEKILEGWKNNKTYPSERCTDYEFIRRASLDIIGRIPTTKELDTYMKQAPEKRRAWLIDAMLDGKEYGYGELYAQNFANLWTIHLITRTGSNQHHKDQLNSWLYERLKGKAPESPKAKPKEKATETAGKDKAKDKDKDKTTETPGAGAKKPRVNPDANEPAEPDWSYIARRLIAGNGETKEDRAVNYLLHNLGEEFKQDQNKNGQWDMVPATSRTTRLFLGIRTQCVQCHDHPFHDSLGQHHFWGMNAFLRQSESVNTSLNMPGRPNPDAVKKKKGQTGNMEFRLIDRKDFNANNLVGYERRNTVYLFIDPTFLDGRKLPKNFTGNRREKLAEFITTSADFSKAYVNRMWGHFFGKSFTKDAVDDFGEHNPISHPELLDKLSNDWAKSYAHNPKTLIRWICNSQAYGLSSRANKWNDKVDDETLFARMLLKPMSPEQMFESLMLATASPFLKDEAKEKRMETKEAWLSKLIVNFGNDEGDEGVYTGTVVQALLLINGQDINNAISDKKDGVVAEVVKRRGASYASLRFAINDLYLHILSRPPSKAEMDDLVSPKTYNFFLKKGGGPAIPPPPTALPATFWQNYYEDIAWALVNSNEFILNH